MTNLISYYNSQCIICKYRISKTLHSVEGTTLSTLGMYIVVDGSIDDTVAKVSFSENGPRITSL
jgi:hypothetical protein